MPFHDAYLRRTPVEMLVPPAERPEETGGGSDPLSPLLEPFAEIGEEAERRDVDPTDEGAFAMLGRVGRWMQELRADEAEAELIRQYGALLYHAYHFVRQGRSAYLLSEGVARSLTGEGWEPQTDRVTLPAASGYLQLPRHLFWSRPGEERPEAVDGLHWTVRDDDRISLLGVLGLRGDRPGMTLVPLPPVPLAEAGVWLTAPVREEGTDFESTLPGGHLDELRSMDLLGEYLKLLGRFFVFATDRADALSARPPGRAEAPDDPPASRLGFWRAAPEPSARPTAGTS